MGMMFSYSLSQCSDWELCRLEKGDSVSRIFKTDPHHWHLTQWEGSAWVYKTRQECLDKLTEQVNYHYDRLYDEEGNHRDDQTTRAAEGKAEPV